MVLAHRRADVRELNEASAPPARRGASWRASRYPDQRGRAGVCGGGPDHLSGEQPRPWREERHGGDGGAGRGRADYGAAGFLIWAGARGVLFPFRWRITRRSIMAMPRPSTKSQGATVDRAFVLASETMDRHLTYVAMTRHRDGATLYASRDEFGDLSALSARLGRGQAKETTLDYAERRGIAEQFGVESQIDVLAREPRPDPSPRPAASAAPVAAPEQDGRSFLDRQAEKAAPVVDSFREQQRESVLDLARSILAQSEASPFGDGAGQRTGPPSSVPALDPAVADAIARGKQAFDVERAVEDGFAAFKADQAQEQAREAEAAQQRALAEAEQKLEQERAEREAERDRSYGMEM